MNEIEKRILNNQIEIMTALSYIITKAYPDLVGRGGELDRYKEDLFAAYKATRKLLEDAYTKL